MTRVNEFLRSSPMFDSVEIAHVHECPKCGAMFACVTEGEHEAVCWSEVCQ